MDNNLTVVKKTEQEIDLGKKDEYFEISIHLKRGMYTNSVNDEFGLPDSDENSICVEEYNGEITTDDDKTLAGKFNLIIFNASLAMNNGYSAMDTFDLGHGITEYYETFYKPDEFEFRKSIGGLPYEHLDILNDNLGIISNMEILPKYQGKRLGSFLVRDIYHFFSGKVGIIGLKSFPIQFEPYTKEENLKDSWRTLMQYQAMKEKQPDIKSAQKSLNKFYTSLGFKKLANIKYGDYFFMNMALENIKMNNL